MEMKKSLIPKSKAKTAYGLLSEIRALILAEPLRYDQRGTLRFVTKSDLDFGFVSDPPACGTIGCVAGWVCALKSARPKAVKERHNVVGYATRTLGLARDQFVELFGASVAGFAPRGPEHADAGAKHIAAFQKKYRAQLLAKKV